MMTMAEKILARASGKEKVEPGEIVEAKVDRVMSHDNAAFVARLFKKIGVDRVWDPERIIIVLDHRVPAPNEQAAMGHKIIREFVKEQGIKYFYDMKAGICHQVMVEKGHALPGNLIIGTDSHTTTYGALGVFSTGVGYTDMAAIWATGKTWLKVPETIKINVEGKLPPMVFSKDVILHIIGELTMDGATYKAVEFHGSTIRDMSIASRLVLSNMSMEMGAKVGLIPVDQKTEEYLKGRAKEEYTVLNPDEGCEYADVYEFNVENLEPQVACPHTVDNVKPISEVEGLPIDQAVLGSCTNGRYEDLEIAARILEKAMKEGKRIHRDVRMIVLPASWDIYLKAMENGLLKTFIKAGAVVANSGCGPCMGSHLGILAKGERAISSTNRNFRGRMGSKEAEVYLASPATVAASAVEGVITDPRKYLR